MLLAINTSPDQETIYRLIYDRQWAALLDLLYYHRATIASDDLLKQAAETFTSVFFNEIRDRDPSEYHNELEKLFLLHTGKFYNLSEKCFEQVVVYLVTIHEHRPKAALGYARYYPENALCARVIDQFGHNERERFSHGQDQLIELSQCPAKRAIDYTVSLFKSQQEIDFFMAVREVFATYLVYPNVALRCIVDYENIKGNLTGEERSYFFMGLIDCVVFDQHDGYRPLYFFELDSALHDDEAQRTKDRHKERILALAGKALYRIRKRGRHVAHTAYISLLKELFDPANKQKKGDISRNV